MNRQMAHRHPSLPDPCEVCEPERHGALLTLAEVGVFMFVGLSLLLACLFAAAAAQ